MCESTVSLNQIPDVAARLDANGLEGSYAVFTFDTQVITAQEGNNTLNLQYAILDGIVGLEWPLVRKRNIADKQRFIDYISQRGYKVSERVQEFNEPEFVDLPYLRVEEGDIVDLGMRIATELYQLPPNTEVSLLVDGFEKPKLMMADVLSFVRKLGSQQGFAADVEQISEVLRAAHGNTWLDKDGAKHHAYATFGTPLGYILLSDVFGDNLYHSFASEILAEPRTQKLEEEILGERGINLLTACGYHRAYTTSNNYEQWFPFTSDKDFREVAEHCVGILHMLFDHQPGQPLETRCYMNNPDLPEALQVHYYEFMARYHEAMAQFHQLMATESLTLPEHQIDELVETCAEMEAVIEDFPKWITELEDLDSSYEALLSSAIGSQTLIIECLNDLRQRFNTQPLH